MSCSISLIYCTMESVRPRSPFLDLSLRARSFGGTALGGAVAAISLPQYTQLSMISVLVERCNFSSNLAASSTVAPARGGALAYVADRFFDTFGSANAILSSTFEGNAVSCLLSESQPNSGGAVFVSLSKQRADLLLGRAFEISDSSFYRNRIYYREGHPPALGVTVLGGAVALNLDVECGVLVPAAVFQRCDFVANGVLAALPGDPQKWDGWGPAKGGSIYLKSASGIEILDCSFSDSYAIGYSASGGAAVFAETQALIITRSRFSNSTLMCLDGPVGILIDGSKSVCRGGHVVASNAMTIRSSEFCKGHVHGAPNFCAFSSGGAVQCKTIIVSDSIFTSHSVVGALTQHLRVSKRFSFLC